MEIQWKSSGNFNEIPTEFQGNANGISMTYQWKSIGNTVKISMKYQWYSIKNLVDIQQKFQ